MQPHQELLENIKKIKVLPEQVEIDESIFKGLDTYEDIDNKFQELFKQKENNLNKISNISLIKLAQSPKSILSDVSDRWKASVQQLKQKQAIKALQQQQRQIKSATRKSQFNRFSLNFNQASFTNISPSPTPFQQLSKAVTQIEKSQAKQQTPNFQRTQSSKQTIFHNRHQNLLNKQQLIENDEVFDLKQAIANRKLSAHQSTKASTGRQATTDRTNNYTNSNLDLKTNILNTSFQQDYLTSKNNEQFDQFIQLINSLVKNDFRIDILGIQKICDYFGIDIMKLHEYKNVQEREQYVIQCMQNTVQQNLIQYEQRQRMRQQKTNKENQKELNQIIKKEKSYADFFQWMQVRGEFKALSKKLKFHLFESLSDYTNQVRLDKYFKYLHNNYYELAHKQVNMDKKKRFSLLSQSRRGSLQSLDQEYSQTQSNQNSPFSYRQQKKKMTQVLLSFSVIKKMQRHFETFKPIIKLDDDEYLKDYIRNNYINTKQTKNFVLQHQKDQKEKQQKLFEQKGTEWDEEREHIFRTYRAEKKKRLLHTIKSNSFNRIGMTPILKEIEFEQKKEGLREVMLQKYANGENLSKDEHKYIAVTSDLLTQNVDKIFLQKAINVIDKEIIKEIELNIAEQIIKSYEEIMLIGQKARYNYFQKIIQQQKEKEKEEEEKRKENIGILEQEVEKKNREQQLQRIRQKVIKALSKIEFKKHVFKEDNPYVKFFMEKLINRVRSKLPKSNTENKAFKDQEFLLRNFPRNPKKPIFNLNSSDPEKRINADQSKKLFHPSSRVILTQPEYFDIKQEFLTDIDDYKTSSIHEYNEKSKEQILKRNFIRIHKQFQQNKKEKLRFHKKTQSENQQLYKEFYSSGPCKPRELNSLAIPDYLRDREYYLRNSQNKFDQEDRDLPQLQKWITKQIEKEAAIMIQKHIRGFIKRKAFKQSVLKMKQAKDNELQTKLNKCYEAKAILDLCKDYVVKKRISQQFTLNRSKSRTHHELSENNIRSKRNSEHEYSNQIKSKSKIEPMSSRFQFEKKGIFKSQVQKKSSPLRASIVQDHLVVPYEHEFQFRMRSHSASKNNNNSQTPSAKKIYQEELIKGIQSGFLTQRSTPLQSVYSTNAKSNNNQNSNTPLSRPSTAQSFHKQLVNHKQFQNEIRAKLKEKLKQIEIKQQEEIRRMQMPKSQQQDTHLNQYQVKDTVQEAESQQITQTPSMKSSFLSSQKIKKQSLLLKHRKLLNSARQSNLFGVKCSGFVFNKEDINIADEQGNTALYYVTKKANKTFIQYLLDAGADVNIRCSNGDTALHMAFQSNSIETIVQFMEKGGDLNVVNDQGMTPVAYAKSTVLQYLMLENATANVNNLKNQQNFKKKLNFDNNEIYWGNQHEIKMKLQREQIENKSQEILFQMDELQENSQKVVGFHQIKQVPSVKTFMTPNEKDYNQMINQLFLKRKQEESEKKNRKPTRSQNNN